MHKKILLLASILGFTPAASVLAGDLGINVMLSGEVAPGVYGQVDIGTAPRPPLVYERPMLIASNARYAHSPAVYLHVPPGHAKHWSKHCHKYHACERQVYFVKSSEYDADDRDGQPNRHGDNKHDHKHHKENHNKGHGNNKH